VAIRPPTSRNLDDSLLGYVAVLAHALIERELRTAMRGSTIVALPLYPERRDRKAPTAARVIEIFEPLYAHELRVAGEVVASFHPTLSKRKYSVNQGGVVGPG